jgi:citrate lyase subunit beta/citryl-CoA lyase
VSAVTAESAATARSLLFVPGPRPDRFAKAHAAGADVVIIDLEDAVAPEDKDEARGHAAKWLAQGNTAMVRINGAGTPWHDADVEAVATRNGSVGVPKAADPDVLSRLTSRGVRVVALVETAAGLVNAAAVAAVPGVERLAFGSIDLAAELGIDPDDREAMLTARHTLVIASAAAGLPGPIDGVTTTLTDRAPLIDDLRHARGLGMTAKLCIHPAQVATVHEVLAPTPDGLARASRVVRSAGSTGAAASVDGRMVHAPVIARAATLLRAAAAVSPRTPSDPPAPASGTEE